LRFVFEFTAEAKKRKQTVSERGVGFIFTTHKTKGFANFDQAPEEVPWYGIEQEYTLFKDGRPMGWPASTARPFNKRQAAVRLGARWPCAAAHPDLGAQARPRRGVGPEQAGDGQG